MANSDFVIPFRRVCLEDVGQVGGKNASLGELIQRLTPQGIRIPDGFAITAAAFRAHLAQHEIDRRIWAALDGLDGRDVGKLAEVGAAIRGWVGEPALPLEVERALLERTSASRPNTARRRPTSPSAPAPPPRICPRPPSPASRRRSSTCAGARGCSRRCATAWRRCSPTARSSIAPSAGSITVDGGAVGRRAEDGALATSASAGVIFTLDTETRLPRRGAHQRRLGPRRVGRQGARESGRVSGCYKPTLAQGVPPDRPARARRQGGQARLRRRGGTESVAEVPRGAGGARAALVLDRRRGR